jgi:FkbM family methyltransferase
VIDAGANVGLITTELLSQDSPAITRLWSFEPDPEAFSQLCQIQDTRLSKFNEALWDSDGTSILFRHKLWLKNHSHTSSSLLKSKSNVDEMNGISVTKTDFARIINDTPFETITIKMDIEGAEYRVINHLIKSGCMKKIHRIYCEFHPNSIRFGYSLHLMLWVRLILTKNSHKVQGWV